MMKKIEYVMRQGDVHIFRIDDFPKGQREQDELTKSNQVALGELSGHNHYFDDSSAVDLFKLKNFEGLTFIDVKKQTELVHGLIKNYKGKESDQDYHNVISLKKGKYITGIVEETDWIHGLVRRVTD